MLTVGEQALGELTPAVMRVVSIFAGGLAGSREELCGALSSGAMIIGMLYGRANLTEDEQLARQLVQDYRKRFLAEFGTTVCRPLRERFCGPEGKATCAPLVERAALMLQEMLAEAQEATGAAS
jgi:C_GCAxxG_C_C family probable redox protein